MKVTRVAHAIFYKAIPLWMVVMLMVQSSAFVGVFEYYVMKKYVNEQLLAMAQKKSPEELAQLLREEIMPMHGYQLGVRWNDIGKKLLDSGVIDLQKYKEAFVQDPGDSDMMKYMSDTSYDHMMISENNSHFMVNTLWAIGLVNKNNILDEGKMKTYGQGDPMQYAATAGWNMSSDSVENLYSSQNMIQLTDTQQKLVQKIADSVYRPCCDNPTSFPDCNHGMAALGYIELGVEQGLSEKRIYKDLLALNSYWFPQQYVNDATYFYKQKIDWNLFDAEKILSKQYSSAQSAQKIQQAVQLYPSNSQGGGCSA